MQSGAVLAGNGCYLTWTPWDPLGLRESCQSCGLEYGARGVAGDAGRALRSVSELRVVSYLESLDPAWPLVKQKSSAKNFCQNMEPRGGGRNLGLLGGL